MDELTAWVDDRLGAAGRSRTGPVELVRERPWGSVWRAAASVGPVWVKRPGATVRFELDLVPALATLPPPLTPNVLGVDARRGWLLLADAGRTYRELYPGRDLPEPFTSALVAVGALQRAAAPLVPDLVTAGVADLGPAALPARFDELVDALGAPTGAVAARHRLVDVAAELAASAVPASVDHNDLHDGNVLRDPGGRTVVLDWGDSVVAHPFTTLLVPQRVLAAVVGADHEAPWDVPVVAAARRAYLAGFAPVAPNEDLERTARIAHAAAHVARAWVWRRSMTTADPTATIGSVTAAEFAEGARAWFERAVRALNALPTD